jgi:hypothetical protein
LLFITNSMKQQKVSWFIQCQPPTKLKQIKIFADF